MAAITLPRSAPDWLGVEPTALQAFLDAVQAEALELHSFMMVRQGHVIAEGWWKPYQANKRHMLFSLSKSFTSTAIGLLVHEGKLKTCDKVVSFFPDDLPETVSENLAAMTVKDLLTMATGHETEPFVFAEKNWVKSFLAHPVEHKPGSKFLYNTPATYMLSAILQKITGENLLQYLTPRLFEPLGIEKPTWQKCPRRICTGGFGLSIRTEDIAKFGLLYLQKGIWEGKQLVPAAWIDEATQKQVDNGPDPENDWNQGYGYQFWRCRHEAYRGDGAFGQYCLVIPNSDVVIAITSGLPDMGRVLNLIWQHLLPAFRAAGQPQGPSFQFSLDIAVPNGRVDSPHAKKLFGKTLRFEDNDRQLESLQVSETSKGLEFVLTAGGKAETYGAGYSEWIAKGQTAGRYAWTDPDTLTMRVAFVETPFVKTYRLRLGEGGVELKEDVSCGFENTDLTPLMAR